MRKFVAYLIALVCIANAAFFYHQSGTDNRLAWLLFAALGCVPAVSVIRHADHVAQRRQAWAYQRARG
jgi:hypothetical protein